MEQIIKAFDNICTPDLIILCDRTLTSENNKANRKDIQQNMNTTPHRTTPPHLHTSTPHHTTPHLTTPHHTTHTTPSSLLQQEADVWSFWMLYGIN